MANDTEYDEVKKMLLDAGVPEDEIPEPVRDDPADVAVLEDSHE